MSESVYTESEVNIIARRAAQEAIAMMLPPYLDNSIAEALSISEGENDMASKQIKARIGDHWVTGTSIQDLVNKAIIKAAAVTPVKTVREYTAEYMKTYKPDGAVEKNTLIGYKGYLKNHIYPAFGDMKLTDVSIDTVQNYINQKSKVLSVKSIREHLNLMGEIFAAAVEDELIPTNPFKSRRLKLVGIKSQNISGYTEDEFSRCVTNLLPLLKGSDLLYAAITLYTGMRRGEICALRWERDIDLENNRIYVREVIIWPSQNKGIIKPSPKTHNGERNIVILPQLGEILAANKQPSGYLIQGKRDRGDEPITNQAIQRMNQRIHQIAAANDIPVELGNRRGRHTVATLMNNAGIDDKTIENQMGHYSAEFTRRQYMNSQTKQIERGMINLSNYMAQITQH